MTDYEKTFEDFWRPLVCNPDGSLDLDKVKRELHDYYNMIENTSEVFSYVTDGAISKPNTCAADVKSVHDDCVNKLVEEEIARHEALTA